MGTAIGIFFKQNSQKHNFSSMVILLNRVALQTVTRFAAQKASKVKVVLALLSGKGGVIHPSRSRFDWVMQIRTLQQSVISSYYSVIVSFIILLPNTCRL